MRKPDCLGLIVVVENDRRVMIHGSIVIDGHDLHNMVNTGGKNSRLFLIIAKINH